MKMNVDFCVSCTQKQPCNLKCPNCGSHYTYLRSDGKRDCNRCNTTWK